MNSYIYRFTHKIKNTFYIGSRCANVLPPDEDFIHVYKSSNNYIKKHTDEFYGEILCEIENDPFGHLAWTLEQQMIEENWTDPLIINKHYETKRGVFANTKPREHKHYVCNECSKNFSKFEFIHKQKRTGVIFCSQKCSSKNANIQLIAKIKNPTTREEYLKHLHFKKGVVSWNKGLEYPQASLNGKKSAEKVRQKALGRKMGIIDGKRTWIYPNGEG